MDDSSDLPEYILGLIKYLDIVIPQTDRNPAEMLPKIKEDEAITCKPWW